MSSPDPFLHLLQHVFRSLSHEACPCLPCDHECDDQERLMRVDRAHKQQAPVGLIPGRLCDYRSDLSMQVEILEPSDLPTLLCSVRSSTYLLVAFVGGSATSPREGDDIFTLWNIGFAFFYAHVIICLKSFHAACKWSMKPEDGAFV